MFDIDQLRKEIKQLTSAELRQKLEAMQGAGFFLCQCS